MPSGGFRSPLVGLGRGLSVASRTDGAKITRKPGP